MSPDLERNLGEQPIAQIMREHHLKAHDLVVVSPGSVTHKMVTRACKGRRLTPNTQSKILGALNRATGKSHSLRDLFNYGRRRAGGSPVCARGVSPEWQLVKPSEICGTSPRRDCSCNSGFDVGFP